MRPTAPTTQTPSRIAPLAVRRWLLAGAAVAMWVTPACSTASDGADGADGANAAVGLPTPDPRFPRRAREPESRQEPAQGISDKEAYGAAMIAGGSALYSGYFELARQHFLHAMALKPTSMSPALGALRALRIRGHAEARNGITERIHRKIAKLKAKPETVGAGYLLQARLHIAEGKPSQAMDAARVAAQLLGELGVAHRVLGEAALAAERWQEAVTAFRRALNLGLQAKPGTWERLADALDEVGAVDEAAEAARKAVSLTGKDRHAKRRRLNLLGVVLKHQGALKEARDTFREALKLGPDDPAVLHNLAALDEREGNLEDALGGYERAIQGGPYPMSSWRAGHVLLKMDRPVVALEAFTAAAAHLGRWTWPASTRWWPAYDVGKLYVRADLYEQAAGWFDDAMRVATSPEAVAEIRSWQTFVQAQNRGDASEQR